MNAAPPLINIEGMTKVFYTEDVETHALSGIHLRIEQGEYVAISGPSGCGKSTLLKCLTGEAPATRGKVFLHNLELTQHYAFLKTLIGYVPQDDIVHRELTVEQSLYFAARLRMEKPTKAQIEAKIQEVLGRLRITPIRHQPISKISGGQRKRVSIALELLTDPLVLFLDEPTSPLDPQSIEEFLKILQELAHKGTTVVMVTHKPEDLAYMDSVIFMAEGGAMVYEGSTTDYKAYFGVRTAVEVYSNIAGERAPYWIQRFQARQGTPQGSSQVANPRLKKRNVRNLFSELHWLGRRYFRIKTNDLLNMAILIGQAPIIAALVCLIFNQLTLSVPFLISLSAIWFGTSNAAREIVAEAAVYRRERMFNLRILPYILSKLVVLSLFGLLQSILFSIIIYLGFRSTSPPWADLESTIVWVWLLTICATALGLTISALVDTAEKAMTLVPLVLIPQVMLGGVVARIHQWPVEVLSYASPTRWGNEGLALIQGYFHDSRVDGVDDPFVRGFIQDSTLASKEILQGQYHDLYEEVYGDWAYTIDLDLMMLGGITVALLVVLTIAMKRKDSI
jgi:ABC-type multidrug transport system ATPase subunit